MAEGAEKAESPREEREGCGTGRDRNAQNNTETGEPSASSEWEDAHSAVARKQAHDQQLQKAKDALRQQMGMRKDLNRSEMIQRDYHSDFLSKVGSKEVVSVANGERPGFFCSVSGHTAADSLSYLDHINGRKQQRALGMSMRVKRATAEEVRGKVEDNKKRDREREGEKKTFEEKVEENIQQEVLKKEQQKARKKQRKQEKQKEEEKMQQEKTAGVDEEVSQMMGFASFGGSGGAKGKAKKQKA